MNGQGRSGLSCGSGTCFPIFTGLRFNGDRFPEDFKHCHVLRCSDGRLFRRKRSDRGDRAPVWDPVNVPNNQPFVFYDVGCETVCLMNFSGGIPGCTPGGNMPVRPINPVPGQPVAPILPVSPINNGGQGGITPGGPGGSIISPVSFALGAPFTGSATTQAFGGNALPFAFQSQTGIFGQVTARLTAAGAVDTTGMIPVASTGILTSNGASTGDDLIFGSVDGGTIAVIQQPIETIVQFPGVGSQFAGPGPFPGAGTQSAGATSSGFARAGAAIVSQGNGPVATGNADNQSTIAATANGAAASGGAIDGSLLQAASEGAKVNGSVTGTSSIRAGGGQPLMRNLPQNSRFIVVDEGVGALGLGGLGEVGRFRNPPEAIRINQIGNMGCEPRSVRLENINDPNPDILGLFSSAFNFGPFIGEFAPGQGLGAGAGGKAMSNGHLLAVADGAFSQGTAECGEVHMAAGKASAVFGQGNVALAPHSTAMGRNAFSYMAGSNVHSSFGAAPNADIPADCIGACQRTTVMTRGSTLCIRDPPVGTQTGFILTTNFVLSDSPTNPVIVTPDGGQIDLSKLPFLHCPGTAFVEADLVSPVLIGKGNENLGPALVAKYFFTVSRTDVNRSSNHDITGFTQAYANPTTIANFITVTAVSNDGIENGFNEGFTLQIQDLVPLEINGQPNPRLRFNAAGEPVNPILGRILCVYFTITFSTFGNTELNCLERDALLFGIGGGGNDNGNGNNNGGRRCRKCNKGNKRQHQECFCDDKGFTPQTPVTFNTGTSLLTSLQNRL